MNPYCTEENLLMVLHEARFAGGVAASGQRHGFGGNLFTRDSLRMMRDTMPAYSFVREMLGILPQWQGTKEDPATNEFPDALTHQVFRSIVGGRHLPHEQVESARYWTNHWGVPLKHNEQWGDWFAIYNSSDGPPLYLITLAEFCATYGQAVLNDSFIHYPTGQTRTIAQAARRLVDFIVRAIRDSESAGRGYYEIPNTNPKQTSPSGVMRDGWDAYFRPDTAKGEPADYSLMAYIENQALAYEALLLAAKVLFPNDKDASSWLEVAENLRTQAIKSFWMPEDNFFCPAIDKKGQVTLHSSAALELLNGPFFEGLPDAPDYVRALVEWLYSKDVMTPIGPRMLSLKHSSFEADYYAYQGTGAVWSVTNGIIAKGLGQWLLQPLREDLGINRLCGWFNHCKAAVEVTYVDRASNQPCYHPEKQKNSKGLAAAEAGQLDQGWGATAALAELWTQNSQPVQPKSDSWQHALCKDIARQIVDLPPASQITSEAALYIDTKVGQQLKKKRANRLGLAS